MSSPPPHGPVDLSAVAHFSKYGNPGIPPAARVQYTSPPLKDPQSTAWDVPLTPEQLETLLRGYMPQDMNEKWIVCAEGLEEGGQGRAVVRFCRSWTGWVVVEVEVEVRFAEDEGGKGIGGARIIGVTWEKSEDRVRGQSEAGAKDTVRDVCRWVLGIEIPIKG